MFKEYREDWPFEVNSDGVVRNKYTKKVYSQSIRKGYYRVATTIGGKRIQCNVHRLVASCFIENPENKPEINHIDGNKLNNHVSNLEWVTSSENRIHAFSTGLQSARYGEDCSSTVLTEEQARIVCQYLEEGYRNCDIESITGINRFQIKDIKRGSAWKLLSKEYDIKDYGRKIPPIPIIEWICEKIQEGFSDEDIVKMSKSRSVTIEWVSRIRNRETHQSTSKHYLF